MMAVLCVKGVEREVLKSQLHLLDDLSTFHCRNKKGKALGEDHISEVYHS